MTLLTSSAIAAADYDWFSQRLHITFTSGGTYTFYRVPPAIYHGLISAESPGRFYNQYIRGRYRP